MTRVGRPAASAPAVRARSRVPKPKVQKHKIILESITQEKKKLRSVISFEAKAPPGYTFIPAGNPLFTNACKEMCRKEGKKVFTVSTTPHQRMHNLSQQVHRIGYHFPSVVVATVCMERGFVLSAGGKVLPYKAGGAGNGRPILPESEQTQTTINSEARDAIKDLFPNIPKKDLNQIIKTAFQKGKRKVGTAVELPLARRAQLAVVAHIRHVYTNYDQLLRVTSFQEARTTVEEPTLAKLVQWRGDDENGKVELEDVFREVIVISDSEDEDLASDGTVLADQDRDSSVEIVSSNTLIGELQTRPANAAELRYPEPNSAHDLSDDDRPPPGFRFVHPEHTRKRKAHKPKPDRRGFNRYQAWDRALHRYREAAHPTNNNSQETPAPSYQALQRAPVRPGEPPAIFHPFPEPVGPLSPVRHPLPSGVVDYSARVPRPVQANEEHREFSMRRREPPDMIRLPDGSIFERAGTSRPRAPEYPPAPPVAHSRPLPQSPRLFPRPHAEQVRYESPTSGLNSPGRPGASVNAQVRRVLPSIEGPFGQIQLADSGPDREHYLPKRHDPNVGTDRQVLIRQAPAETIPVGINDSRQPAPQKKRRLGQENFPPAYFDRGGKRPYPPASETDLGGIQPESLDPFGLRRHARLGDRPLSPGPQRHSYPYPRHPEGSNLSMVRMAVADRQPIRVTSHTNQVTGEDRHGQRSHIPLSPPTFSRSDGSGYMPRDDAHAIRSGHSSHFIPSQQQPPRQGFSDRGALGANRKALVRSPSPERQHFASTVTTTRPEMYAHDFVRPVDARDYLAASSRAEPESYLSRHIRAVPTGHAANYARMDPGRPGGESRFIPPAHHASRSPSPPISFSNASRQGFGSNIPTHTAHPLSHSANHFSQRQYTQEAQSPRPHLLGDGRPPNHEEPYRPIYRTVPDGLPVADGAPRYVRIPQRAGLVVSKN